MPSLQPDSGPTAVVIPARWGSSRFPGKPLHHIAGKPLVQHVWERCRNCEGIHDVVIATDDDRIRRAVSDFGGIAVMTSPDHPSGTDRIAEVLESFPDWELVINVQGDEPLMDPKLVEQLARDLREDTDIDIVTAASPIREAALVDNPNIVKVVTDLTGRALYFSRAPIPCLREGGLSTTALRHLGIYGYRADFLRRFVTWPPSSLEQSECLEQLRALEHGGRIRVVLTNEVSPGVDTPEQAAEVEAILRAAPPLSQTSS